MGAKVKENLQDWKEILVHLKHILMWEEQWHPALVGGGVSLLFLIIWATEPTLLSLLSLILLLFTLTEYILPFVAPKLFPIETWNESSELDYVNICAYLVNFKYQAREALFKVQIMKSERPRLYLALTGIGLMILAWLGSALGDLFLLGIALYPGAIRNPVIAAKINGISEKMKALL